jgi:PilZ domain
MTLDMAFECLLVSRDLSVVEIMSTLLTDLGICTTVHPTVSQALDHFFRGGTDLVIVDVQKDSQELLRTLNDAKRPKRPPVIAVSERAEAVPVGYPLLLKPITTESGAPLLREVYSKLLEDYRQHARYAIMKPLIARNQYGRSVQLTVINIGEGGIGISTGEFLSRGDLLSFSIVLPGQEVPIDIEARVLWIREYGAAGCEYAAISHEDRQQLHDWLKQKCQVKSPLITRENTANYAGNQFS